MEAYENENKWGKLIGAMVLLGPVYASLLMENIFGLFVCGYGFGCQVLEYFSKLCYVWEC